jgi:hypothetical protein
MHSLFTFIEINLKHACKNAKETDIILATIIVIKLSIIQKYFILGYALLKLDI